MRQIIISRSAKKIRGKNPFYYPGCVPFFSYYIFFLFSFYCDLLMIVKGIEVTCPSLWLLLLFPSTYTYCWYFIHETIFSWNRNFFFFFYVIFLPLSLTLNSRFLMLLWFFFLLFFFDVVSLFYPVSETTYNWFPQKKISFLSSSHVYKFWWITYFSK